MNFFKELCEDALKAGPIGTKQMIRLGKKSETGPRPLRVTLTNKDDREK